MSKQVLRITEDGKLTLPLNGFLTSTQSIVAKKRRGKSYLAQVQAEELLRFKQQIVVLDPTSAWWGLRSSSDGKGPGYPVVVFGGDHGDVSLEPDGGEALANAVVDEGFSIVIDTSNLRKGERLRFATDFLETLYRKNKRAMHLFVDEADVFAPQIPRDPQQARLLGATDELVRRGGIKGIGVTLITQRPQVVNKDVLSQIDTLMVLQMNHPKDIGAIEDWVVAHVDKDKAREMLASLPKLPIGSAWIWAPEAEIFERVQIRRKTTYDSGRTPMAGERRSAPVLAKIDIERLGKSISDAVERDRANDPKVLKMKMAVLEKQLAAKISQAKASAAPDSTEPKIVTKFALKDGQLKRVEAAIAAGQKLLDRVQIPALALTSFADKITDGLTTLRLAVFRTTTAPAAPSGYGMPPSRHGGTTAGLRRTVQEDCLPVRSLPARPAKEPVAAAGGLTGPQLALLTAMAWWRAMGHDAPTKAQLAGKAGWRPKGSNLRNRLSELHSAGLVEYPRSGVVSLTAAGVAAAPQPNTTETLIDSVRSVLTGPQSAVFEALLAGGQQGRIALAEAIGWEPGGSNLRNRLSELSAMELVDYPSIGNVALQPWVTAP